MAVNSYMSRMTFTTNTSTTLRSTTLPLRNSDLWKNQISPYILGKNFPSYYDFSKGLNLYAQTYHTRCNNNEHMHLSTHAEVETYHVHLADLHTQPLAPWRRHAPESPKSWPVSPILDLDPYPGPSGLSVLPKALA